MNAKTKILFIIPEMGIGGAEKQLYKLVTGLDPKRYDITLCVLWNIIDNSYNLDAYCYIHIETLDKAKCGSLYTFFRLIFLMRRIKPDIVHTWMSGGNLWGRLAAILVRIKIIISCNRDIDLRESKVWDILEKTLSLFTDRIVTNSQAIKKHLTHKLNIPEKKIIIIKNCL